MSKETLTTKKTLMSKETLTMKETLMSKENLIMMTKAGSRRTMSGKKTCQHCGKTQGTDQACWAKDKKCLLCGRKGHFKVCPKHTGQGSPWIERPWIRRTPWIERPWIRRLSRLAESETRTLTKKAEDTKLSATSMTRRPKLLSQGGEGGEMVMIVYPMMDGNNFEKSSLRHRTTEHPGLEGTSGGTERTGTKDYNSDLFINNSART